MNVQGIVFVIEREMILPWCLHNSSLTKLFLMSLLFFTAIKLKNYVRTAMFIYKVSLGLIFVSYLAGLGVDFSCTRKTNVPVIVFVDISHTPLLISCTGFKVNNNFIIFLIILSLNFYTLSLKFLF